MDVRAAEESTCAVDGSVLAGWVTTLGAVDPTDDVSRVDALRLLEQVKCAAAGAQARITAAFADSQRALQQEAGVPARRLGAGVAAQVALARRESPFRGQQHLGLAWALREMPHTAAALSRGEVTEWRATLMVRETACLSRPDRGIVDAELAGRAGGLGGLGDRATEAEARRVAYRLDPYAFTRRAAKAEADRRVSIRPAPDTMTFVTGLLPVTQGVAVHAALTRHADTLRSDGDLRSRGQIMADTLVERVTGQTAATAVPLEVNVVITAGALLAADDTPAEVEGFGPVPAPLARQWLTGTGTGDTVTGTGDTLEPAGVTPDWRFSRPTGSTRPTRSAEATDAEEAHVFLRRLFTDPAGENLVAMDSTRRTFVGGLRRYISHRDRRCRTPWCDAPIRHIDHPLRVADGGRTSATNSQALCEACNQAKEATGWHAHPTGDDDMVETRTPTGHRYSSRPPMPVGGPRNLSRMDAFFGTVLLLAG
jgi:hypothetical protein